VLTTVRTPCWCALIYYLNWLYYPEEIKCRVRRIAEVTRGVTNRDQYEKVSREIRYDFYRACLEEEASDGLGLGVSGRQLVSGVIFGHHLVRPSCWMLLLLVTLTLTDTFTF